MSEQERCWWKKQLIEKNALIELSNQALEDAATGLDREIKRVKEAEAEIKRLHGNLNTATERGAEVERKLKIAKVILGDVTHDYSLAGAMCRARIGLADLEGEKKELESKTSEPDWRTIEADAECEAVDFNAGSCNEYMATAILWLKKRIEVHEKEFHTAYELQLENKMILAEEIKNGKHRIGFAVAIGKGQVGYSICHPTLDTWNYGRGIEIAIGRAKKGVKWVIRMGHLMCVFEKQGKINDLHKIEKIMIPALAAMELKAKRFYRNKK